MVSSMGLPQAETLDATVEGTGECKTTMRTGGESARSLPVTQHNREHP